MFCFGGRLYESEGIIFVFIHLYSSIPSPNIYANPTQHQLPTNTYHQHHFTPKIHQKTPKNTNFGQFLGARGQFTVIAATF